MAKKKYVVTLGCIQEGAKTFNLGEPYSPPTAAFETELVGLGVIATADSPDGLAAIAKLKAAQGEAPEAPAEAEITTE